MAKKIQPSGSKSQIPAKRREIKGGQVRHVDDRLPKTMKTG